MGVRFDRHQEQHDIGSALPGIVKDTVFKWATQMAGQAGTWARTFQDKSMCTSECVWLLILTSRIVRLDNRSSAILQTKSRSSLPVTYGRVNPKTKTKTIAT